MNAKMLEITHISGHYRQPVDGRHSGDHGILNQCVRSPVHQLGPFPKGMSIHRQYLVGGEHAVEPCFQFRCFDCVLLSNDFNSRLNFADRDSGKVQLVGGYTPDPVQN